jgi:basic amino acid/polyamine antiporter, APA family
MPAQQQTLNRALSSGGASAISTGLAFAAINFLGIAQMLGYIRGPLAWAAVLCAGVVILAVRALFSELNGMYPTAAGIRLWMARAMNDRLALIITFTYMAAIILVIAADAFIIGEAIAYAFSNGHTVAIIYVAVLLAVAIWLNLRGIRLVGAAEKIITTLVVALTIAVGAAALFRHGHPAQSSAGVQGSPVSALILGIFLYTGFEWVTTNSEEVIRPKIIPKAMLVAIGALAASQALFAVAMGLTLDHGQLGTVYPQLLVAQAVFGRAGLLLMLAVTAPTAVNTFNGGFVTMSRFMYAVAREGKLPRTFTYLNDRAVPAVPVLILGITSLVVAIAVAATGTWAMMVSVCAALEMMIYATAGFVVWRLRRTQAGADRPFRFRGGRWLALAFTVLFGILGLMASLTVGSKTSLAPLVTLAVIAGLVSIYVFTYVPRLERRDAAELAARRAVRAAARAARAGSQPPANPNAPRELQDAPEGTP